MILLIQFIADRTPALTITQNVVIKIRTRSAKI